MNKIFINNRLVPEKQASISVFDRSYLYGEGVFESMRAYHGKPAFISLHYHRLNENCRALGIDMPFDQYAFEKSVIKTLQTNHLKSAYIRVTVSSVGISVGISRPRKIKSNVVIFCKRYRQPDEKIYHRGARVIIVNSICGEDPRLASIKSTSYLPKMLARQEIEKAGVDEGLLQGPQGLILEASSSNVFIVKGDTIYTPPISDGILPGITRFVVLGLADTLRIRLVEQHLTIEDLEDADEIFLTGSLKEILPIREVVELTQKIAPGEITLRLMAAYQALLPH